MEFYHCTAAVSLSSVKATNCKSVLAYGFLFAYVPVTGAYVYPVANIWVVESNKTVTASCFSLIVYLLF